MIKVTAHKTFQAISLRLGMVLALLVGLLGSTTASAAGETWSPLGDGMNADVHALAFDSSGNLYAGGSFTTAGGENANRVAKWNGSTWSALGSGMNNEVYALAFDGSGNLYAGGKFTSAGGVTANRIAKWNGSTWSPLGSGMNEEVYALVVDGSGNLYAGGSFAIAGGGTANRIAKWDGTSWSAVGSGTGGKVNALAFDSGGNLYAGGSFTTAGGVPVKYVAKWNGSLWSALSSEVSSTVRALAVDGSGNLYAGGDFANASGMPASRIAKWDGTSWSPLGSGMGGTTKDVYALAIDSSGNLYAGGEFTSAGGVASNRVAKWNGSAWSALGSGVDEIVRALAFDSENLYVGGGFTSAGGVSANRIARWATPLPGIVLTTGSSLFCTGENTTISINMTDVVDLFGYQFVVHYDPSLVSAAGAFVNAFFDTSTNASVPSGWNASCSGGECKFAASKMDPGTPVTGSGTVSQITLTGLSAGTFDLTLSDDILSDRDAQAMDHDITSLPLTVCGYANVSGTVSLQGRATPINVGQVTLTDLGGVFAPYTTNFNASTGAFSIHNIKVMPGGSNYQFDAAHGLYLGNRTTHTLNPLDSYTAPATRLLGGDANNDGLIDLGDLTCVGGSFGGTPVACGVTGSSDLNADGVVNILDLVLPGGNYGLTSPRAW